MSILSFDFFMKERISLVESEVLENIVVLNDWRVIIIAATVE